MLVHLSFFGLCFLIIVYSLYTPLPQDVILLSYSPDMFNKNRVMAIARKHLKQQGIVGLHQAPCFRGLLQRLPTMLQEQFLYEKVNVLKVLLLHGLPNISIF